MSGIRRRVFSALNRGIGRDILAFARSAQLTFRGEPTWVRPSAGGWQHTTNRGRLTLPEPRGYGVRGWEKLTREIFLDDYIPQADDIIVELGAGYGTETLALARMVGPNGQVLAVEAHPQTANALRRNVADNKLGNVTVIQAAIVAEKSATIRISDGSIRDTQANRLVTSGGIEVPACTLDDLVKDCGIDTVHLLKMNIEGAEAAALRGGTQVLGITRNTVIGCHDFLAEREGDPALRTLEEVTQTLRNHGFAVRRRVDPRDWAAHYLYGAKISIEDYS